MLGILIILALAILLKPESNPAIPQPSPAIPEPDKTITGRAIEEPFIVTKVVDGDTVHINGESTRLICIDTPERGEEGYQESTKYLESLILNKEVILEEDITKRDKYNRLLYYIFTKKGDFVNEIMVREGYAKAYPYFPDTRLCPQIQEAEKQAKALGKGIWEPEEIKKPAQQEETGASCSSNLYNCGDFNTHAEAQAVFDACGGISNDIHRLDQDKDGLACETLS